MNDGGKQFYTIDDPRSWADDEPLVIRSVLGVELLRSFDLRLAENSRVH